MLLSFDLPVPRGAPATTKGTAMSFTEMNGKVRGNKVRGNKVR
jgi:hypothetical protein